MLRYIYNELATVQPSRPGFQLAIMVTMSVQFFNSEVSHHTDAVTVCIMLRVTRICMAAQQ